MPGNASITTLFRGQSLCFISEHFILRPDALYFTTRVVTTAQGHQRAQNLWSQELLSRKTFVSYTDVGILLFSFIYISYSCLPKGHMHTERACSFQWCDAAFISNRKYT